MKLLIAKDFNLLRGIFLMGKVSKFLAVGQDFPPSPGFPIKVRRRGEQSTPGRCNNFYLAYDSGDLVLIELFQISHNCVNECMLKAKFIKLFQTLLEIPFSPICGILQYVIILSNRRKKLTPPPPTSASPVPSLIGTS